MAEQAREYEEEYFRKRSRYSMAQRLTEEPHNQTNEELKLPYHQDNSISVEVALPQEDLPGPQENVLSNTGSKVVVRRGFSKGEKGFLVLIGLCMMCLTIWNLMVQYRDERITVVTQEYQIKTSEIQNQTDILLNELALKYDYQTIKQIALENGMTLQNSQVRNVGE